ncbi:MAG: N-6 DNA methylase [Acidobacteria bacterium]|nr:N-6 DNA methylase [Acidobacteriota bacterium]
MISNTPPPGPLRDAAKIRAAVSRYGAELGPRMRGDGRREDQLRAPIYALLKELGNILGRDVHVHDEVTLSDRTARPDFAVDTTAGRTGYIELKALEKGIPDKDWRPTKHDREQFEKLSVLPNLIYTNGKYWGLYRRGILTGRVAVLEGDLARAGERLTPADDELERLFREFLVWKPDHPTTIRGVVSEVAPLCRLLRDQVTETIAYERTHPGKRPFTTLANEWRSILFPTLDDDAFSDAYAQAVTFALLLARVDGIAFDNRSLTDIATQLSKQHSLMGEALSILTNPRWVSHLSIVETLRRVIGNVDWDDVQFGKSGAYALLYETFLAEYDPKLRRKSGTYYTPDSVARAMVSFVDQVLKTRLGKRRGFAADDVIVVDPAMGTGTFLVEIIDSVVKTLCAERGSAVVPEAHLRELFEKRLVGFELQVASFAVAELRLHHTLKQRYNVELPREEVRFLSNAFDDPDTQSIDFGQLYEILKESREGANRIKRDEPVMVVIGNPPWREHARGEAPWLEAARDQRIVPSDLRIRPSLDEFRARGQARRAFNLSNMWTFFWRWATWKVFDANPEEPAGVVALITPKAYLSSESYAGMRRYLRETADEGWIIDVTPEGFQPNVPTRIFPGVQQPICIGVFARFGPPERTTPARIHHTAVVGDQQEKFRQLLALRPSDDIWKETPTNWEDPFQPVDSDWIFYPKLVDLFPWQQPGVKPNRGWVYAPDKATLTRRWSRLIKADKDMKSELFKETRDRTLDRTFPTLSGVPSGDQSLSGETSDEPLIVPVGYRCFDRQYLIHDRRVIDFPRPELWQVSGDNQECYWKLALKKNRPIVA